MSSGQHIDRLMKRTRQYYYEDGFSDLGMGSLLLALALLFLAESITPPGSALWLVWEFGWPVLLIGGGLMVSRLVQWAKSRYTYPRTGYVSYERQGRSRVVRLIAVFLVAALVAGAAIALSRGWHNLTLWFALAFTAAFTYVGFRAALVRYLLLGLWSLIAGLALAPLSLTIEQSGAAFFGAVGLGMIVSGWSAWRHYNRTAPSEQERGDGRPS